MTAPTAIITGASRGIGAAVAARLARDGFTVEVIHRDSAAEAVGVVTRIADAGGIARAVTLDVTDSDAVDRYADELAGREVAVLVNNAGVTADALLLQTTDDAWRTVIDTNLGGTFRMCRAVAGLMMDRGGGAIVNVSSNSAVIPGPGQAAYAASKGGIEALSRALAVELGKVGIRVNVVRPGRVRTRMAEAAAGVLDAMGLAPWGEPEQVADVVAFLAGPDSGYVTGQVLTADGGLSVTRPQERR